MERSLFRRIARYGVSATADPRENRLTEVFAAVLASKSVAGLARHVASGWLELAQEGFASDTGLPLPAATEAQLQALRNALADESAAGHVEVVTQFSFDTVDAERRRPDLIMSFSSAGHEPIQLWVEIKHGTGPHDHQLQAYTNELRRRGMQTSIVLLVAPRAGYVDFAVDEMPDEVPRLTWEDTGRLIESFTPEDAVGNFLKTELVKYLTEEGLMDPKELTPAHLSALANYHTGRQALDRVCELAGERVNKLWAVGERPGHYPAAHPSEYWWRYPAVARDGTAIVAPEPAGPVWQLLVDGAYLFSDVDVGVPLLAVGLSGQHGWIAHLDPDRRASAEAAGFRMYRAQETKSRKNEYAYARATLDEIFTKGTLGEQADLLASWIDLQFRKLAGSLGP
jgi:hypothetical protein